MEEGCSLSCGFGASNSKAPVDAELWEIWFAVLLLPITFNCNNWLIYKAECISKQVFSYLNANFLKQQVQTGIF